MVACLRCKTLFCLLNPVEVRLQLLLLAVVVPVHHALLLVGHDVVLVEAGGVNDCPLHVARQLLFFHKLVSELVGGCKSDCGVTDAVEVYLVLLFGAHHCGGCVLRVAVLLVLLESGLVLHLQKGLHGDCFGGLDAHAHSVEDALLGHAGFDLPFVHVVQLEGRGGVVHFAVVWRKVASLYQVILLGVGAPQTFVALPSIYKPYFWKCLLRFYVFFYFLRPLFRRRCCVRLLFLFLNQQFGWSLKILPLLFLFGLSALLLFGLNRGRLSSIFGDEGVNGCNNVVKQLLLLQAAQFVL